jgi:hypothetical protein
MTDDQKLEIAILVEEGHKMEAIRLYRSIIGYVSATIALHCVMIIYNECVILK